MCLGPERVIGCLAFDSPACPHEKHGVAGLGIAAQHQVRVIAGRRFWNLIKSVKTMHLAHTEASVSLEQQIAGDCHGCCRMPQWTMKPKRDGMLL